MPASHPSNAGGYISHRAAQRLLPVSSLPSGVEQYREAGVRLEDVDADAVVAVRPTGFASGYALAQHPLTTIEVDALPDDVRASIDELADVEIGAFEVVRIGGDRNEPADHSLSEY